MPRRKFRRAKPVVVDVVVDVLTPDSDIKEEDVVRDPPGSHSSSKDAPSDNKNPFSQHASDAASVWPMYLNEAKSLDEALVEIWNSDLDSLLIFAGLFSAILTAFLVEVRKGLQEDAQETTNRLLETILFEIRNNTPPSRSSTDLNPQHAIVWVNGLWFVGLTFSLMSALGAVLAKGWVAQYTSASNGRNGRDARDRQRRYNSIKRWHFRTVISSIPVFLHVAFFLFFAGLVVLLSSDDTRIAYAVWPFVLLTTLFYLFSTFIPTVFPHTPFKTPVSDLVSRFLHVWISCIALLQIPPVIFLHLTINVIHNRIPSARTSLISTYHVLVQKRRYLMESAKLLTAPLSIDYLRRTFKMMQEKPKDGDLAADALAWLLSASVDQETICDAVRAIAGTPPSMHLQNTLWKKGADVVLSRGLSDVIKRSPGTVTTVNEELAGAYLYALLQLFEPSHQDLPRTSMALRSLVAETGPLFRWDDLKPGLRVVGYIVHAFINFQTGLKDMGRVTWKRERYGHEVDLLLESGLHQHQWQVLVRALGLRIKNGGEEEWTHGLVLVTALCRHGRRMAQWEPDQQTEDKMQEMLIRIGLGKMIMKGLMKGLGRKADAMRHLEQLLQDDKMRHEICVVDLLWKLPDALKDVNREIRWTAVKVFTAVIQHDDMHAELAIPNILERLLGTLKDDNWDIRQATLEAFTVMIKKDNVCTMLALPDLVQKLLDLSNDGRWEVSDAAIDTLIAVIQHEDTFIELAIPKILQGLLEGDENGKAKETATRLYAEAIQHYGLHTKLPIPDFTQLLLDALNDQRFEVTLEIPMALTAAFKIDNIRVEVPIPSLHQKLLDAFNDKDQHVRNTAVKTFSACALYDDMCAQLTTPELLQKLLDLFQDENWLVLWSVIGAFTAILKHNDMHAKLPMPDLLQKFMDALKHNMSFVRTAAIAAVTVFAQHYGMHAGLTTPGLLELLLELLKDNDKYIQMATQEAFTEIMQSDEICTEILNSDFPTKILGAMDYGKYDDQLCMAQVIMEIIQHDDMHSNLLDYQAVIKFSHHLTDILIHHPYPAQAAKMLIELGKYDITRIGLKEANILGKLSVGELLVSTPGDSSVWLARARAMSFLVMRGVGPGQEMVYNILQGITTKFDGEFIGDPAAFAVLITHGSMPLQVIDILVQQLCHTKNAHHRSIALHSLGKIMNSKDSQTEIAQKYLSSQLLKAFKHPDSVIQDYTLVGYLKCTQNGTINEEFKKYEVIQKLMDILRAHDEDIKQDAFEAFSTVLNDDGLCNLIPIPELLQHIFDRFKIGQWDVKEAAMDLFMKVIQHNAIYARIMIPEFLQTLMMHTLNEEYWFPQEFITKAFTAVMQHDDIYVRLLITDLLQILLHSLQCGSKVIPHPAIEMFGVVMQCDDMRSKLMKLDLLPKLLDILKDKDSDIQNNAINALEIALNYDDVHSEAVKLDVFQRLLDILKDQDSNIQKNAINALVMVVNYDDIRSEVVKLDVCQRLLNDLSCKHELGQEAATRLYMAVIQYDDVFAGLSVPDLLQNLLSALTDQNRHVRLGTAQAFMVLVENDEIFAQFLKLDILQKLLDALKDKDSQDATVLVFIAMMQHCTIRTELTKLNFCQRLLDDLNNKDQGIQIFTIRILKAIIKYDDMFVSLAKFDFIKWLFDVLKEENEDVMIEGLELLGELLQCSDIHTECTEQDLLQMLVKIIKTEEWHVRHVVLRIFKIVIQHGYMNKKLSVSNLLLKLLDFFKDEDYYAQDAAKQVFMAVVKQDEMHAELIRLDILLKLFDVLRDASGSVQESTVRAFTTVIQHDKLCIACCTPNVLSQLMNHFQDAMTRDWAGATLAMVAKHRNIRALLSIPDITVDILTHEFIPFPHYYGPGMLLCELLLHDDSRPVVLKLEASRRVFQLFGGPECLEATSAVVKHLDMIGVIDKTTIPD